MKYLKIMVIAVAGALIPALSWASLNGSARISLIEGDALIRTQDSEEWLPASINTPLNEGDSIWSPAGSRVEIQLQNGSLIRLDRESALDILALDEAFMQFHVGMGHAYVGTGAMHDKSLQIEVDGASVKVYDRVRLRIDFSPDGDTDVSVIKGLAYVESDGRSTRVRSGEMLSMEEGSAEISPIEPPDEWERWNVERDRRFFARRSGYGYLPAELAAYGSDLDDNGKWTYVQEYGNVWRPTVIVAQDWSPYTVGRWVWMSGDYVWISYERWGWAPYHYGRWISLPALGWCWVPPVRGEVYWGPGYVGWVSTPQYIGWVPLAPGEVYYGRGYYGRNSVNITQVNVRNITVNNAAYRNIHISNAVKVVNRSSFVTGSITYVKPRENIFSNRNVQFGRPDIKPERQAMMPVIKTVSQSKLPPPAIRTVHVRELRERHPNSQGNPRAVRYGNGGTYERNGRVERRIPQNQKGAGPETVKAPPEVPRDAGKQEQSQPRPEVVEYPGRRPPGGERQKPNSPDSRLWRETRNSDTNGNAEFQPRGRATETKKDPPPGSDGRAKISPALRRQDEWSAVTPIQPVKGPGPDRQNVFPRQMKKPEKPDFSGGSVERRAGKPANFEKPAVKPVEPAAAQKAGGRTDGKPAKIDKKPAIKPVEPGAAQNTGSQAEAPPQRGAKKVRKVKEPENQADDGKKETRDLEKGHDKQARPAVQ